MKRNLIALGLVLMAACVVAATWTPVQFRVTGTAYTGNSYNLIFDSVRVYGDSLRVDTVYSDTVDISEKTRMSVYLQLGAVTKATHGNDSVTIRMDLYTDAQSPYAGGYKIVGDTFGGNNITGVDEATRRINLLLDTVPAQRAWMRTIIGSRVDSSFGTALVETTKVPLHYYLLVR